MALIHPAWLWALAALAVPLALHLLQRRATVPRDFPPAVLLEAGAAEAARARRVRELVLLAARMLLLAAVALCFARPELAGGPGDVSDSSAATRPALGMVLVIDDSPSMARPADPAAPQGPTRIERALAEARTALAGLGPGSEAAVLFASGRSAGPGEPTGIARELSAAAGPSVRADAGRPLAAAGEFLEAMEPLPGTVLVFSDCEADALPPEPLARLIEHHSLAVVDLGAPGAGDDWALLDARMAAPRLTAGEPGTMLARVSRSGQAAGRGPAARRLELVLDGVAVGWRDVTLEPGAEAEVEIEFSVGAGSHFGELRLAGADPWPANDRLSAAVCAAAPPRVAVIAGRRELGRSAEAVRLALSAGPGAERKAFLAEKLAPESLAFENPAGTRAIVLVGPPRLPDAAVSRLGRALADGAGAVVMVSDPEALDALAVPLALPSPAAGGEIATFAAPARLVPTADGSSLFAPFKGAAGQACFRKAVRLKAEGGTVLATLRSGDGELPGIVERAFGRSAIIELASSPEKGWSDLAGREQAELFVPLVHELTARAAGLTEAEVLAAPGSTVKIPATGRERGARLWIEDPSGLRSPAGSPDESLVVRFSAPATPGTWRILSEADGAILAERALAVRLPAAELSGRREKSGRLDGLLVGSGAAVARLGESQRSGREISTWIAALALALLGFELLAERMAPRPPLQQTADADQPMGPPRRKRGGTGAPS